MSEYSVVDIRLDLVKTRSYYRDLSGKFLIIMTRSLAPYIHVILADVVSIT